MYPQLLPWYAKRFDVDESTAKIAWNTAEIQSRLLFGTTDPAFVFDRFQYLLSFTHHSMEILKMFTLPLIGPSLTERIFKKQEI